MFFAVKDEYVQSAIKFTLSPKPNNESHFFVETFPLITLNDIMPEIEEEESGIASSDICQQEKTFRKMCPEFPFSLENFDIMCCTFAVDLLFALKEGLPENKMVLLK
jgi:hypothetical protein